MITVVIFTLRDVMRNVQTQFRIPHHGISHTSPQTKTDIEELMGWLVTHNLQTYTKNRPGKDHILQVRDLMVTGAAYASTPSAFKNYRAEKRNVTFKKAQGPTTTGDESEEEEVPEDDLDQVDTFGDASVEPDDLMQDDEEFTAMAEDLMDMAEEIVGSEGM